MLSRLSIRAKITIGSVLVAAVFFGATLFAVRLEVQAILQSSDATLAAGDLTSYAAEILKNPTGLSDDSDTGALVFIRDPDGVVQFDSMTHDLHEAVEHRSAANTQLTVAADGTDYSVVGRKVTASDGVWTLWAARSEASNELTLRGLDAVLAIGGLVLLAGFGVASWVLASAALRPVARMRLQAEKLSAVEGAVGLPVGEARDEITALAITLNAFLDRVRRSTAREKQVLSDTAHELRTPLAAVKTQLELAHDNFDDPQALVERVIAAERSVDRLSSLASNLLALSRLEAGETDLVSSTTGELVDELMDAIDRARLIALASAVEVSFSIDLASNEHRYQLSPTAFSRIIDNLVANAIVAATPSGRIAVSLSEEAAGLRLIVTDDGPGMPSAFMERAFDRFSRADDSRTGATGGSGLGLALVKAISDSAGGSVSLRNLDPGLEVLVVLPGSNM